MPELVALHGFTQRGSAFEELEGALGVPIAAPDLPGHGGEPVSGWDATVDHLAGELERWGTTPILLGYSMGGRLSLGVAARHPGVISALVVVSAGPGIGDEARRAARRRDDEALAGRIERIGVEAFLDEWLAGPMFAGLAGRGAVWRAADRARRSTNDAAGLSGALRHLGQGVMPDLRPALGTVHVPVLLVVGEKDRRYRALAGEMEALLPAASTVVVRDAGHSVVGEQPDALAEVLSLWW